MPALCLECVQTRMRREPSTALPLLLESLAGIKLHVSGAASLIHIVINMAQMDVFPAEMLMVTVKVVDSILKSLKPNEAEEAISALVDFCCEMARSSAETRQAELASALLPVCLQSRNQRLLTTKSDKLKNLLISRGLTHEGHVMLLDTLQHITPVRDLLTSVVTQLKIEIATSSSPQQVASMLDIASRLVSAFPARDQQHDDDNNVLQNTCGHLVSIIKRALMSRDVRLQVLGARCLLALLLRNEANLNNSLLNDDLGEFIISTLNSTNYDMLQTMFRCVSCLVQTKVTAEYLYSRDLASRLQHSLLRALHLLLIQSRDLQAQVAAHTCFKLLAMMFHHSQRAEKLQDMTLIGPQVLKLVQQVFDLNFEDTKEILNIRAVAALVISELLLATQKGAAEDWPDLLHIVQKCVEQYDSNKTNNKKFSCFVFRLIKGAIPAVSGKNDVRKAMLKWAEQTILEHAAQCIFNGPVRTSMLYQFLSSVETLFDEPAWDRKISLSYNLTTQGFLHLANRLVTEPSLSKHGPTVLSRVLSSFSKPILGNTIQHEILREGLRELSNPWLSVDSPAQSPEARDAALVLSYCTALVSKDPYATCTPLLSGLHALLKSPLGAAYRMPLTSAKAAIFLLACLNTDNSEDVQKLLLRWAPVAHLVFTPHPKLLDWIFSKSFAPLEMRASFIAEWIAKGYSTLILSENLSKFPSALPCVLEVLHNDQRAHVSHSALRVVKQANTESNVGAYFIEQLWLRLPLLLQRQSAGPHGKALLLQLVSELGTPPNPDVLIAALPPVCALLPDIVSHYEPRSWTHCTRIASFAVTKIIINATQDSRLLPGLMYLLESTKFLQALETLLNEEGADEGRRVAVQVATALLALQKRLKNNAPRPAQSIWLNSYSLITILEGAASSVGTPEYRLSRTTLHLVAHLTDPSLNPDPGAYVAVRVKDGEDFNSALYITLHYIQGINNDTRMNIACWDALHTVIQWRGTRSMVGIPWTHTLIWDAQIPHSVEGAKAMLFFTRKWTRLLYKSQSRQPIPTKLRLLSTTVGYLINEADYIAQLDGCLAPFIDTIAACLQMEHELAPKIVQLAKNKLEELRIRS